MHSLTWLGLCLIVVVAWGVLGIFEKLAANHLAPTAALLWVACGYVVLQAFAVPHHLGGYPSSSLILALVNGILSAFGFLALLSAMHHGGKASIVEPLSALYPVLVAFVAPRLFGEKATLQHSLGIGCAILAVWLLTGDAFGSPREPRPQ